MAKAGQFKPAALLASFGKLFVEAPSTASPLDDELGFFQLRDEKGNLTKDFVAQFLPNLKVSRWKASHWQFLDLASDFATSGSSTKLTRVLCERTPILVAHEADETVIVLAVESRPGPHGMIAPDWWKIGLIPFPNNAFVKAIHAGFREVTSRHPGKRIRLRWWLEKHPKADWPDALGDGSSAQAAAACAALALFDEDRHRPILDQITAVSATLSPDSSDDLEKKLVVRVEYAENKIEAAKKAKLISAVFADGQDDVESTKEGFLVEKVKTLGEVYDSLRVTSRPIQAYMDAIVHDWGEDWVEKPTHEDFKNASRKQS